MVDGSIGPLTPVEICPWRPLVPFGWGSSSHGPRRSTVRRALLLVGPPRYQRPAAPVTLDSFREEINGLLREDSLPSGHAHPRRAQRQDLTRVETILDDFPRAVRPLFLPRPRAFRRATYPPRVPAR